MELFATDIPLRPAFIALFLYRNTVRAKFADAGERLHRAGAVRKPVASIAAFPRHLRRSGVRRMSDSKVAEIIACVNGDKATREFVATEVRKLAKDAERYRWLRRRGTERFLENSWWDEHDIIRLGYDDYEHLTEEALDAAIDKALIDCNVAKEE